MLNAASQVKPVVRLEGVPPWAARLKEAAWSVSLLLLLLSAGFLYLWHRGAPRRALSELPVGERTPIFRRASENFSALCEPRPPNDLRSRCAEDAAFLRDFPECDDACRVRLRDF